MFYGFAAVWVILLGYVLLLVSREKDIKKQLASLKNMLDERDSKATRQ